jgi:hypothetical protein
MPTSYTAILEEKNNPSFKDFAMRCARAFGALFDMRDYPLDEEIPEEFKPDNYHIEALEKAKASLIAVKNMTMEECFKKAIEEKEKRIESYRKGVEQERKLLSRYVAMRKQVKAWTPPTKDHTRLKEFMLEQLKVSWPSVEFAEEHLWKAESVVIGTNKWKETEIKRLEEDIEYHTEENKKEIERAKERTEWVKQLRKSL